MACGACIKKSRSSWTNVLSFPVTQQLLLKTTCEIVTALPFSVLFQMNVLCTLSWAGQTVRVASEKASGLVHVSSSENCTTPLPGAPPGVYVKVLSWMSVEFPRIPMKLSPASIDRVLL